MFSVVIQAGGKSSRMGTDKVFLPFRGQALIERVTGRLAPLTDDLLIISNQADKLKQLQYPAYPDLIAGCGPLGGLYTGLVYARYPAVVMVACDMPFANPALLAKEAGLLDELNVDVVIPAPGEKTEPLHAAYRKETCLPFIEEGLKTGMRRLIEWHSWVRVYQLSEQEIQTYNPHGLAFLNINTPQELKSAESMDTYDIQT